MTLPHHLCQMSDELRRAAAGNAQFDPGCSAVRWSAQQTLLRRFICRVPDGGKIGAVRPAGKIKDAPGRLIDPANAAIFLQKHSRPGSLFENKIRFAPHPATGRLPFFADGTKQNWRKV